MGDHAHQWAYRNLYGHSARDRWKHVFGDHVEALEQSHVPSLAAVVRN